MTKILNNTPNDIVITGLGMLTSNGLGMDANLETFHAPANKKTQEDYKIKGFNPAPHLSDRKVVKVVSHRDVLGLVAFEECLKNSGLSAQTIDPDRTGLYVGAPPSSCSDHHNYEEGITAATDSSGVLNEKNFGETFRTANPTTLLTGLPNNVLCYGAKTLDARGPNSNYTTLETSSHMALIGAIRSMKLGRLDCAIAGGYTAHSDKVFTSAMKMRGYAECTPIAEGAVFATIEQRSSADKRGAKAVCRVLACAAGSDAIGPYGKMDEASVFPDLIKNCLASACVQTEDVEIIMLTGSEVPSVTTGEKSAIQKVWNDKTTPILATTATRWGNLMEAGGIAEIGFLKNAYDKGEIPASAVTEGWEGTKNTKSFNPSNKIALILRASPYGEYSCLIVKMEAP